MRVSFSSISMNCKKYRVCLSTYILGWREFSFTKLLHCRDKSTIAY
jgi:hypothetical protein